MNKLLTPLFLIYYLFVEVFIGGYEEELHKYTTDMLSIAVMCICGLFVTFVISKVYPDMWPDYMTVIGCYLFGTFLLARKEKEDENHE